MHWQVVQAKRSRGTKRFTAGIVCLVTLFTVVANAQATKPPFESFTTPGGVEYGLWGPMSKQPAPILFVLAGSIEETLGNSYFRQCGNELAEHGYLCVSIDLPCHGTQSREGQPAGLSGWSYRAAKGKDFVAECNARLSKVLDHLIQTSVADPDRIAACGTSRGGFLAIHFAAHDSRVKCAAGFAPVTDLAALSEFRRVTEHKLVKKLSLVNQADRLAGRPVWIVIGDQDERVGTQHAIELAGRLTTAAREKELSSAVQLHVMPEPRGHTTPQGSSRLAADWILGHLPTSTKKVAVRQQQRHLLFVDDHHVLYRSGTKRVFHGTTLNPSNPIIREDKPWEMAIAWTSVVRNAETGKYQLWYQAYAGHRDERKSHRCVVCYAESDDGVTFTKPSLGIHDFKTEREPWNGHFTDTNIVLIGDNGYGDRYANSVVFESDEPDAAKRYKMLYTDFSPEPDGHEWPGFHAAFSADGIHWAKSERNPLNRTAYAGRGLQPPYDDEEVYAEVLDKSKNFLRKTWKIPLSMSDAADVMVDPIHGKYVVYGKAWLQGPAGGLAWKHAMARVESDDFLSWSKPVIVCSPDDHDPPNTEFHTSPVFFYKGCYFCMNQILSARGEAIGAKADAMHIELMISRDGLRWERPFRDQPFIASAEQAFSNGGIFTNATPVILSDAIRFYYGGYNRGATDGGKLTDASEQSGVGFASLPLDRFAGIRPVPISAQSTLKKPLENIGQVTLKPTSLEGIHELFINGDANNGAIRVEVLNEDGYRIRGFSKDDAVALTSDSIRHHVTWKERKLDQLPPGDYLLRLHLENAEVFAMSFE